jgi:predicted nucleotidyltransferase
MPASQPRLDDIRRELAAMLPELRQRYPVSYLGVFGSWVRGEQTADSDLDLLVDFDGSIDLFAYARLQEEIGRRLALRVDLVQRSGLKPAIGANILREVQPV